MRMSPQFRSSCTLLAILASVVSPADALRAQAVDDQRDIAAVLARFTDAMRDKDTAGVRAVFDPGARLVGMRQREGAPPYVQSLSVSDFVAFLGRDTRPHWTERLWSPEVMVNGTLASVWAEYDFHFGSTFSHCGIDAIQLLKTVAGWRIVSIADTFTLAPCTRRTPPAP